MKKKYLIISGLFISIAAILMLFFQNCNEDLTDNSPKASAVSEEDLAKFKYVMDVISTTTENTDDDDNPLECSKITKKEVTLNIEGKEHVVTEYIALEFNNCNNQKYDIDVTMNMEFNALEFAHVKLENPENVEVYSKVEQQYMDFSSNKEEDPKVKADVTVTYKEAEGPFEVIENDGVHYEYRAYFEKITGYVTIDGNTYKDEAIVGLFDTNYTTIRISGEDIDPSTVIPGNTSETSDSLPNAKLRRNDKVNNFFKGFIFF